MAGNVLFFQEQQGNGRARIERGQQTNLGNLARRSAAEPVEGAGATSSNGLPVVINAQPNISAPPTPSGRTAGKPAVGETAPAAAGGETPEITASIQRELQARGYEPGTPDGVAGAVTRAAIMAWESDQGLAITGEPTEAVMKAIVLGVSKPVAAQITAQYQALPKEKRARAEQLLRTVQQSLSALGYNLGKVTGRMNEDTERAIREFETDQAMVQSGRISGPLVARLARLTASGRSGAGLR